MFKECVLGTGRFGPRLELAGAWRPEYAAFMRRESISELYLNYALGWDGDDLEFLRTTPHLQAFGILDLLIKDVSPVHVLRELRSLELSTYCRTKLDFSAWPRLEDCFLNWRAGAESLFSSAGIKTLFLSAYPEVSSHVFGGFTAMHDLTVANSRLEEIHSLARLQGLQHLGLHNLRRLKSLSGIEGLHKLKALSVNGCIGITELDAISTLINLESLTLNDLGRIASLAPVLQLQKLRSLSFYGSTNVVDGSMDVLLDLPNLASVAMQNRTHYSRDREHVITTLAARKAQRENDER